MKIKNIFLLFLAFVFLTTPAFSAPPMYGGPGDQSNVAITGGTINGATIGATTPAAGAFTTLKATTGAAAGLILQSDASGNLTYTDPAAAANAGLSGMVNPKQMAQGVNMTYAASGSSGIVVADNDNIDFGTGNFTLVWKGSLPDWTPGSAAVLFYKYVGGATPTGIVGYITATGYLQIYLNETNFTSSVPVGAVDNSVVELFASFSVGATQTTCVISKDGQLLGSPIIAANVGSINNAIPLYISGDNGSRTASTTVEFAVLNRALTAAEVLDLYRNGIAEADKWGSQTVGIIATGDNSTFASDTGFWSKSGVTVTIPGDGYAYFTDSPDSSFLSPASADVFTIGDYYRITVTVAGYTKGALRVTDGAGGAAWGMVVADGVHSFDRKATRTDLYLLTAGETTLKVDTIVITKLGATLALEPSGIKTPKWFDSSTNALDASYPTTGSSLTLSYQPGTESLLSITTVSLAADADTTIFTVPTGRRCVLTKAILVVGADAASTDFSIGADGAETDWLPTNQLDNLDAANDAAILMPVPATTPSKIESYAAGTVIQAKVSNQAGGATNTLYLFGFLY